MCNILNVVSPSHANGSLLDTTDVNAVES